jgi:hypothetical protein
MQEQAQRRPQRPGGPCRCLGGTLAACCASPPRAIPRHSSPRAPLGAIARARARVRVRVRALRCPPRTRPAPATTQRRCRFETLSVVPAARCPLPVSHASHASQYPAARPRHDPQTERKGRHPPRLSPHALLTKLHRANGSPPRGSGPSARRTMSTSTRPASGSTAASTSAIMVRHPRPRQRHS